MIAGPYFDAASAFRAMAKYEKTLAVDCDSDEILETAGRFAPGAYFHKRRDELAGQGGENGRHREVLSHASRIGTDLRTPWLTSNITSPLAHQEISRELRLFF
jgi:CMP-N-acetylneuraminic acid synthetase